MIKLNGVEIKPTIFPDGTSQVWNLDPQLIAHSPFHKNIEWEFENEAEFMHVAQLRHLLEMKNVSLHMPFLPYGRQDKNISNDETFARTTFLRLLRSLDFYKISTLDIHSESSQLIHNIFPNKEIDVAFELAKPSMVCFPDQGAKDRYGAYFGKFSTCSFSKERDQKTGHIKRLYLNELIDVKGETVLICDDLCDGGMTFKLTAEKLLTLGAKDAMLYTTHGLYTKGTQTLRDSGISRIFDRKGEVFSDGD